ncbi:MAG TPA: hypothetical protein VFZ48_00300 [Candidatus Saccharimonadales bacterium]
MTVTFAGMVVGANRRYPEALGALLPAGVGRDFFSQLHQGGDKKSFNIMLGSDGGWLYNANVDEKNIFLVITPVRGRLDLAQVREFQKAHDLPHEHAVFGATGASDLRLREMIRQNLLAGRPWDRGCNFG